LRLAQHHIQKAEYGTFYDKQIEEVMQDIQEFPGHLSLDDQGLFAIGYYHQRNALFRKSDPLNQAKE
jgi:CRISPR-associated protein Csd1